jgi:hypothetical protein
MKEAPVARRRMPLASILSLVVLIAATVLAGSVGSGGNQAGRSGSEAEGPGEEARAEGLVEEAQEQRETVELREEALEQARAAGIAGKTGPITNAPAPGWVGERLLRFSDDDWEPAIATDPNAPFVYVLTTAYGADPACAKNCPTPPIVLKVSTDGGRTFGQNRYLCECRRVGGQFDPIIEVVPSTGAVYAIWMNDFNVVFAKSVDHGRTWSEPVPTWGNVAWNDKPVLATSDDGRDVYVSWNGPTAGDVWVAQSHDRGETWTQTRVVSSKRYFFAYDAVVLPGGTIVFSEGSISYTGPGITPEGVVQQHAIISRDDGATWENRIIDTVELGAPCVAEGCLPDFYLGHSAVSADEDGDLIFLYDGATTPLGPQRIFAQRSVDAGRSWSARVPLSRAGENSTSPAVEATRDGDIRAWYMETSNGDPDAWNVWYRSSMDLGATWSSPVKLSDATSGAGYKSTEGFDEVYGDYGEIAILSNGKTIAVWGEGFSWTGPGGTWLNRQR